MLGGITDPSLTQGSWCIAQVINNATSDTSTVLSPDEQFILAVQMPNTATTNTRFTVYLQPASGAVLPVTRTIPGGLTPVMVLY
jgi:flagellin FlaB